MKERFLQFSKKVWNDSVGSKVIAIAIVALISTLYAEIRGLSFKDFFLQRIRIELPFYQVAILISLFIIGFYINRKRLETKKKKKENTVQNQEEKPNLIEEEYKAFRTEKTFKYFDSIANAANSRLHFDNFDRDVVNYYIAKGILIEYQPGYGTYILTAKGREFFKVRSIEKIRRKKKAI